MMTTPNRRYKPEPTKDEYGLSLKPQQIDEHNWYYEHRSYAELVHEVRDRAGYVRTDMICIPWRKLEASLKRRNKGRAR